MLLTPYVISYIINHITLNLIHDSILWAWCPKSSKQLELYFLPSSHSNISTHQDVQLSDVRFHIRWTMDLDNVLTFTNTHIYISVCRAFLNCGMAEQTSTLYPLLHLSFHLLSAQSPPSIHFLRQVAISHSVHLTLGSLCRSYRPLSLLLGSFSLYRVVRADSSGRDKVLMLGSKVTAPVLQQHSWRARDPSPHGIPSAAQR